MDLGLGHFIGLASLLFGIGAIGFLVRRNVLIQLMSIELMLNRWMPGNHAGQVFAFFNIAIAAAEAAVGLAIVISVYRLKKSVQNDSVDLLKH
jgi:NADH-quinone oxidoreductase subunit K